MQFESVSRGTESSTVENIRGLFALIIRRKQNKYFIHLREHSGRQNIELELKTLCGLV